MGGQRHAPAALRPENKVPIVQVVGWEPESIWMATENVVHTGVRTSDRSARND